MKQRLTALLLALCMLAGLLPAVSAAGQNPFQDIKPKDWFYDSVQYMFGNGLMSGTGATTFSPGTTTTRGMMVTVLYRLDGEPDDIGNKSFSDVKSGYYLDAVTWAASNSIVAGYEDGRFLPNSPITREQMALILYQYADYKGYDVSASANLNTFPDGRKTSSWARNALAWANAEGIINGTTEGGRTILDPSGKATRAQLSMVFYTFVQKIVNDAPETYTVDFLLNAPEGSAPSGGLWEQQQVEKGETCARPGRDPAFEGYVFKGWYSIDGQPFDFTAPITGNTTVEARWEKAAPNSFKVTFNLGYEGAPAPTVSTVQPGKPATAPAQPSREGYKFLGWFTQAQGGEQYMFDKAVTADTTLYAQWVESKTVAVSFNLNYTGGGTIDTKNVVAGQLCPPLGFEPKREDYIFDGWFTAATDGVKFDFNTPVTEDTALYAHWTYNGPNWAVPYQKTRYITQYDGVDPLRYYSMMGIHYDQGLVWDAPYDRVDTEASFNLFGKYDALTFDFGHIDNGRRTDATFYIYFDGGTTPVDEIHLNGIMSTQHYVLNVKGRTNLRILRRGGEGYAYATANMLLLTADDVLEQGITLPAVSSTTVVKKTNLTPGHVLSYQSASKYVGYYDGSDPLKNFSMMGLPYDQGITLVADYDSMETDVLFNLGGSYEMFSFTIGHLDNGRRANAEIRVYQDDELKDTISLNAIMSTTTYSLNVRGVNKLRLARVGGEGYAYGLANVTAYTAADIQSQGLTVPVLSASSEINQTNLTAGKVLPYQRSSKYITYFDDTNKLNKFFMTTFEFTQGIRLEAAYDGVDTDLLFNVGKNFSSITFTVGHIDGGRTTDAVLYIYKDDVLYESDTVQLTGNMPNKDVTIDLTGVNKLRIVRHGREGYDYGLANITIS